MAFGRGAIEEAQTHPAIQQKRALEAEKGNIILDAIGTVLGSLVGGGGVSKLLSGKGYGAGGVRGVVRKGVGPMSARTIGIPDPQNIARAGLSEVDQAIVMHRNWLRQAAKELPFEDFRDIVSSGKGKVYNMLLGLDDEQALKRFWSEGGGL